jgi:hypothetical protein
VPAIITNQVVIADQSQLNTESVKLDVDKAIRMPTVERMPVDRQEGTPPQSLPPASLFGPLFGNPVDVFTGHSKPPTLPAAPTFSLWDMTNSQGVTFDEAFMEGFDPESIAPVFIDAPNMDLGLASVAIMDRFGALRGGSGK